MNYPGAEEGDGTNKFMASLVYDLPTQDTITAQGKTVFFMTNSIHDERIFLDYIVSGGLRKGDDKVWVGHIQVAVQTDTTPPNIEIGNTEGQRKESFTRKKVN